MPNAVLIPILYAGLAGTLFALIVATYQQKWSLRVFFLLALRVAIGWHFLFEGLHKIHSHYAGPGEYNRVFTSEPYFKAAQGPLGPFMRKQFDDSASTIKDRVTGPREMSAEGVARLGAGMQSAMCPLPVAKELDDLIDEVVKSIQAEADADVKAADAAEATGLAAAKTDAEKAKVKERAEKDRAAAKLKREQAATKTSLERREAALRTYALWVYGVEGRDCKLKGITNDVPMSAPQRLAHIETLRKLVSDEEDRLKAGLGNGFGIDQKKASELRIDLINAQTDLSKDIDSFVAELKKDMLGSAKVPEVAVAAEPSMGQRMDGFTMWFLVVVGGCIIGGLFTRVACLAGVGFLALTYLTHPPFPWYPLPPNTEGNPVFINKNAIEALALLVLATFPTGSWLGIDALIGRICGCGRNCETTPRV